MTILEKLITHEDNYHIHKTLGLLCLFNYGYQYYLFISTGSYHLNIWTVAPHILLHNSSFIFNVLSKRPTESKLSMFIWEELRIHALIFAWRACFIILFTEYSQTITLASMICADIATRYCGNPGVSTVRGKHSNIEKRGWIKRASGAFFSVSQMGATIITSGVFQPRVSPILVFSTLPPIQTSAFGMTLIRKNMITHSIWTIAYSFELLTTYVFYYKEFGNIYLFPIALLLYLIRSYNVSKYVIWIGVFLVHNQYYVKYMTI